MYNEHMFHILIFLVTYFIMYKIIMCLSRIPSSASNIQRSFPVIANNLTLYIQFLLVFLRMVYQAHLEYSSLFGHLDKYCITLYASVIGFYHLGDQTDDLQNLFYIFRRFLPGWHTLHKDKPIIHVMRKEQSHVHIKTNC